MGNEIAEFNGVAFGDIAKVNGVAGGSINHINGLDLVQSFSAAYSNTSIGSATTAARIYDDERGVGSYTTYDPSTDQHIHVYGDGGNSYYGTMDANIKTASTYYRGTPYVYHSGGTTIFNIAFYDAAKSRLVFGFEAWDGSYYEPWIGTANVGAKQSSTNPYDFASGDFTETDSSTSTIYQVSVADGTSGQSRSLNSNFISYNPTYDVYTSTWNEETSEKSFVKAYYCNSNGELTAGTAVEFLNSFYDKISLSVYDGNIERTVLMYNTSSSAGKIRVVKHTGTGSVADRVALSLDSEINHYHLPSGTKGGYEGVFAQYYPEATAIFHFTGSTDAGGLRYFRLSGSDGAGYSKVGNDNDKDGDDVASIWTYWELPSDGQSDHGGASMHYVKGRGRLVLVGIDDDHSSLSGSYDARATAIILEWNASRYAAGNTQTAEYTMLGYTGSAGGGVIFVNHDIQPPGYSSAYHGTAWWTMGAYGETHINERPEGLFGVITMDGGFNDQIMLTFLEPGTTGSP